MATPASPEHSRASASRRPSGGLAAASSAAAAHPLARKVRDILLVPPPAELAPIRAALDDIAALYPLSPASGAAAAVDIERARRHLGRDAERQAARAAKDFAAVLGNVHQV